MMTREQAEALLVYIDAALDARMDETDRQKYYQMAGTKDRFLRLCPQYVGTLTQPE